MRRGGSDGAPSSETSLPRAPSSDMLAVEDGVGSERMCTTPAAAPAMVPSCFRPTLHLLPIEQAPPYARSQYILYWYRPKMKPMSGALTLFRLHNETLNIWSHLLGAIWVCAMLMDTCSMPDAAVRNEGQRHATVVYLLTALFCTFSSALYHLFGGILSPRTYRRLFNLDINGISVVIAGSYYPGLLFAFRCNPAAWYFYSCTTASLLVVVSYAVNFDVRDSTRVMTQVLLVVFGLAPSIHWGVITPPEARVRHLSLLVRATPLTRARGRSHTHPRTPPRVVHASASRPPCAAADVRVLRRRLRRVLSAAHPRAVGPAQARAVRHRRVAPVVAPLRPGGDASVVHPVLHVDNRCVAGMRTWVVVVVV